jgi:hypothetical protein
LQPVLARLPSLNQGAHHQTTLVERHLALASVSFDLVKFAFVHSLFHRDAVRVDVTPTQRWHLADAERSEND